MVGAGDEENPQPILGMRMPRREGGADGSRLELRLKHGPIEGMDGIRKQAVADEDNVVAVVVVVMAAAADDAHDVHDADNDDDAAVHTCGVLEGAPSKTGGPCGILSSSCWSVGGQEMVN